VTYMSSGSGNLTSISPQYIGEIRQPTMSAVWCIARSACMLRIILNIRKTLAIRWYGWCHEKWNLCSRCIGPVGVEQARSVSGWMV